MTLKLTFNQAVERLKELDIRSVLDYLGISYKNNYHRVIFSLRDEREASCSAVCKNNIWLWRDFGNDAYRGTNIDLYRIVRGLSFSDAVLEMADIFLSGIESNNEVKDSQKEDIKSNVRVISVMDKFLDKQIEYLKQREVYPVPNQIKPVIYEVGDKKRYGIGMQTLNGGWVIRQTLDITKSSGTRYLFIGQGDITYWSGVGDKLIVVEGMFDGISAIKLSKQKNIQILILNSTSNCKKAITFIKDNKSRFNKIVLALDMDEAGISTANLMYNDLKDVVETKILKYNAKDLNELLIQKTMTTEDKILSLLDVPKKVSQNIKPPSP